MMSCSTFAAKHCWLLIVAVSTALFGSHTNAQHQTGPATLGVVGVVGRWSEETSANESVVLVEESVNHTRSAAEVDQIATALFGRAAPAFAANAAAPGAFSLGVLRHFSNFTSGTFRARFKLVSGKSDQTAGLVFDLQPTGEYSFVRYNTREGNIAVWRYADGKRVVLARSDEKVQLPLDVWHELALEISGTEIVGTVNDALRIKHRLERAVDGRIGFWTKRDSVTAFKDIRVKSAP